MHLIIIFLAFTVINDVSKRQTGLIEHLEQRVKIFEVEILHCGDEEFDKLVLEYLDNCKHSPKDKVECLDRRAEEVKKNLYNLRLEFYYQCMKGEDGWKIRL